MSDFGKEDFWNDMSAFSGMVFFHHFPATLRELGREFMVVCSSSLSSCSRENVLLAVHIRVDVVHNHIHLPKAGKQSEELPVHDDFGSSLCEPRGFAALCAKEIPPQRMR
ncbi:hypothetical protein RB195_017316 [Necator americanus]|uniref:Uncharacterized protein n=1 Tax=Necator americanus TaxID=51031 RepID=A0ABR1C4P4_NECAM